MFLFASNGADVNLKRLHSLGCADGNWHVASDGTGIATWLESPFTRGRTLAGNVTIEIQRPGKREDTVCRFDWNKKTGRVTVRRRWSGEFAAYVATEPKQIISSHLRLTVMAYGRVPLGMKPLSAGESLSLSVKKPGSRRVTGRRIVRAGRRLNYSALVKRVRSLVYSSVRELPDSAALLLSGGLDSSIVAAVAHDVGRRLPTFVFSLNPTQSPTGMESDLYCARLVAAHLDMACEEILIDPETVIKNVPLAVLLAETSRGTIIDPCAAVIEVAKHLSGKGYRAVVLCDAADDLFGGFSFALRYYRGAQLARYFKTELDKGLPDELAVLQRVFERWGIAVIDPYWTPELKAIGYNLPLRYRVDPKRRMKRLLRDAFANMLPDAIAQRPKLAARDGAQVRNALEEKFGRSRERYRPLYKKLFLEGGIWPVEIQAPKN